MSPYLREVVSILDRFILLTINKTNVDNNIILKRLSADSLLLPDYSSSKKSAIKIQKKSVFSQFCDTSPINEKRKLGTFQTPYEKKEYAIQNEYNLFLNLILKSNYIF